MPWLSVKVFHGHIYMLAAVERQLIEFNRYYKVKARFCRPPIFGLSDGEVSIWEDNFVVMLGLSVLVVLKLLGGLLKILNAK